MAGRYDSNPFDEEEVNPFSDPAVRKTSGKPKFGGGAFYTTTSGSVPPATNSRLSPLPHEPAGFSYDRDAPIDIPLDSAADLKKKERELQAKETELRRREQEVKRKEEAAARVHGAAPTAASAAVALPGPAVGGETLGWTRQLLHVTRALLFTHHSRPYNATFGVPSVRASVPGSIPTPYDPVAEPGYPAKP
ncbi:hypothetical protein ACOSP7_012123 [Xanthoceras sorbifolium]